MPETIPGPRAPDLAPSEGGLDKSTRTRHRLAALTRGIARLRRMTFDADCREQRRSDSPQLLTPLVDELGRHLEALGRLHLDSEQLELAQVGLELGLDREDGAA